MENIGRIYKGEDFDLSLKLPNSGTVENIDIKFFTDCDLAFQPQQDRITVSGDTIYVHFEDRDLDPLNEGVLNYYLKYTLDGDDNVVSTNTMHYLKTRDGYDAKTTQEIYEEGMVSGATEQRSKMIEIEITENGTYSRADGYSQITVNTPTYTFQNKTYNITQNGTITIITPDHGYDAITGGTISVNVPSAGTTNLGKTINITSNGTSQVSTSIEHTFDWQHSRTGHTGSYEFTITGEWPDGTYWLGKIQAIDRYDDDANSYIDIFVTNGRLDFDDDDWNENKYGDINFNFNNDHTQMTITCDFDEGYYDFDFWRERPEGYTADGTYILGSINVNVDIPQSGHTDAEIQAAYNSGYSAGIAYQQSLLSSTAFTENGTYTNENGWNVVVVGNPEPPHINVNRLEIMNTSREVNTLTCYHETFGRLFYSTDGETWIELPLNENFTYDIPVGESIYFHGHDINWLGGEWGSIKINCTHSHDVFGDVTALYRHDIYLSATTTPIQTWCPLFSGDTTLVHADQLTFGNVTTLTPHFCDSMFAGCTSLIAPPELPMTGMAHYCYQYMFRDCTSLTKAPVLPATSLYDFCYNFMFLGCTNLSEIRVGASSWQSADALPHDTSYHWVDGVSQTGTFYKPTNTVIPTGINGIPSGWTVMNVTPPSA